MNFFDAQDRARRSTRLLVIAYLLATAVIVAGVTLVVAIAIPASSMTSVGPLASASPGVMVGTAIATTLVIFGATLIRMASLSSGGAKVATSMGGVLVSPDTTDPQRRRLRNVVEEMSIASGVPTPDIFVLEEESGINAFAAGYTPNDAAIAVTRGALEVLDRDELQGVIAHEFSHILNGDMRLSIRMMGVLYGIMVLGLLGRTLLRGSRYGALSSRRSKNSGAFLIIGLGLAVLGGIGVLIARLVKAAVSRQRESLADASAVQFTRQTRGIADALKKIGGYSAGSKITARDPEEVSHMLFGPGAAFSRMFATHPPIVERIRALDPGFDPADFPDVDAQLASGTAGGDDIPAAGFSASTRAIDPESIVSSVGQPSPEHILLAQSIRSELPEVLYSAAHSSRDALLLAIALVLDEDDRSAQLAIIREQLGAERASTVAGFADAIDAAGREVRLPLLEIAFPALKRRPDAQLTYLARLLSRLIDVDGRTSLYEYCFYQIIINGLDEAMDPTALPRREKLTRERVQRAVINLLRIVARHGDRPAPERAFAAGLAELPGWASKATLGEPAADPAAVLDESLATLNALNGDSKERLIRAISATIMADQEMTHVEAELLRAVCATLDCPLPPFASLHD